MSTSPLAAEPLDTATPTKVGNVRWLICAMLFAASTINYMDRQIIGLLKPTLMHDIGITEETFGRIVAAFQLAYTVGLVLTGRLIDKLGARLGYSLVMAVWSAAGAAHALVGSAMGFGAARVALGLGEGGNFPAAIKATTEWFPKRERSFATGIFNAGTTTGAILAPFVVAWITKRYGWHAAFVTLGVLGAPWIVWWYSRYRTPNQDKAVTPAELAWIHSDEEESQERTEDLRWLDLLRYRRTWVLTAARSITDPIWWFYLFWLPGFLNTRFHLSLQQQGVPLALIYLGSAVGGIGGGYLASFLVRRGMTETRARLTTMLIFACLSLPMLVISHVTQLWLAVLLFSIVLGGHQGWSANMYTTVSDSFPARAVGSVTGISIMAGSLFGIALSLGIGRILQLTGSYTPMFILAGSVYLIAWLNLRFFGEGLRRIQLRS